MKHNSMPLLAFALLLAACQYDVYDYMTTAGTSDATSDVVGTPNATSATTTTTGDGSGATTTASTDTTATNDTTTTQGDTRDVTGCEFVCETDMPGGTIECDPWSQDCPEGQKCAAWDQSGDGAWDSTKCVPVTGDGQHGDPCAAPNGGTSGEDTCAKGHMCFNVDGKTDEGTCFALCMGTLRAPVCAPEGTRCQVGRDGVLSLCISGCNPLIQDCQGNNELCIPDPQGDGFVCVLDASGDMHPAGTPCEFVNQCNAGNICLNLDFYPHPDCQGYLGCCGPLCDLSAPQCPAEPSGLSCEPWYQEGMAPSGYEDVGICIVPQ
ncbi:MAG: ribulose phosphate epimerase [Nannocystaceae bacterium]|nr:ribulose phosphate epimerase [Myxococcales bacterium]